MPAAGGLQWPSPFCLPAGKNLYLKNNNNKKMDLHLLGPSGSFGSRWGDGRCLFPVNSVWGSQDRKGSSAAPMPGVSGAYTACLASPLGSNFNPKNGTQP